MAPVHTKQIVSTEWKQSAIALGPERLNEIRGRNLPADELAKHLARVNEVNEIFEANFGILPDGPSAWELQTEALSYGAAVAEESVRGFVHVKLERKHGAIVANSVPITEEDGLIADHFREMTNELVRTHRIRVKTRN